MARQLHEIIAEVREWLREIERGRCSRQTEWLFELCDAAEFASERRADVCAQMDGVRSALGNGADESLWPPGLTVHEAVSRLVEHAEYLERQVEAVRAVHRGE